MTVGCSVCSHLLVSIYPACVFTLTSPTWTSNSQRGGGGRLSGNNARRENKTPVFSSCLCVAHVRVRACHLLHEDFRRRRRTCTHELFVEAVFVELGSFETLSCHMQSARCCARPSLRPDSSKTRTWFDWGHVFWCTTAALPLWTLWISAMTYFKISRNDGGVHTSLLPATKLTQC